MLMCLLFEQYSVHGLLRSAFRGLAEAITALDRWLAESIAYIWDLYRFVERLQLAWSLVQGVVPLLVAGAPSRAAFRPRLLHHS